MSNNKGTLLPATARPISPLDVYPIAYANEIKGGCHNYRNLAERDSTPIDRLNEGMLCTVGTDIYIYLGSSWQSLTISGDSGTGDTDTGTTPTNEGRKTFIQSSPSTLWIINHNLNRIPIVKSFDNLGREIEGAVSNPSFHSTVIEFNTPQAGSVEYV